MTRITSRCSKLYLAVAIGFLALVSQTPLLADAAPAWDLKDIQGKSVKLSDFQGKVVILDFWATWCPPCRAEIPNFIALQEKYGKQGLVIVGASVDQGGPQVVASFAEKNKINYTLVMADENITQQYGVNEGIPTTFVIDRKETSSPSTSAKPIPLPSKRKSRAYFKPGAFPSFLLEQPVRISGSGYFSATRNPSALSARKI